MLLPTLAAGVDFPPVTPGVEAASGSGAAAGGAADGAGGVGAAPAPPPPSLPMTPLPKLKDGRPLVEGEPKEKEDDSKVVVVGVGSETDLGGSPNCVCNEGDIMVPPGIVDGVDGVPNP